MIFLTKNCSFQVFSLLNSYISFILQNNRIRMTNSSFSRILILALLFGACSKTEEVSQEIPTENFRNEVLATEVKVAVAERKSFDYLINATGKLEAVNEAKMIIEQDGYLTDVYVMEGQQVAKGQILARLNPIEAELRLEKAKIALIKAKADHEVLKINFYSALESKDPAVVRTVEEKIKVNSGWALAEVELKEAELNLQRCEVRAPIAGKVASIKFKKGSLVMRNQEFSVLIGGEQLMLRVKVLESDIPLISLNQKAEIYPVSNSQEALNGRVLAINPLVDESGLVQVSVLMNAQRNLLPGMNARAIIRAPQSNSLVVPKDALVYRSGRAVVFTVENGKESKWNYVVPGKDNGEEVEILEGLEANTTVITTNNLQLAHQAPVQIIKD
jgi:RND family efflux transporter MFP subunit